MVAISFGLFQVFCIVRVNEIREEVLLIGRGRGGGVIGIGPLRILRLPHDALLTCFVVL